MKQLCKYDKNTKKDKKTGSIRRCLHSTHAFWGGGGNCIYKNGAIHISINFRVRKYFKLAIFFRIWTVYLDIWILIYLIIHYSYGMRQLVDFEIGKFWV